MLLLNFIETMHEVCHLCRQPTLQVEETEMRKHCLNKHFYVCTVEMFEVKNIFY